MLLHMATIISRDLLYDIVPTANNMVLCISKFIEDRSHVKCSYHEKKKKKKKVNKETQRNFEWC